MLKMLERRYMFLRGINDFVPAIAAYILYMEKFQTYLSFCLYGSLIIHEQEIRINHTALLYFIIILWNNARNNIIFICASNN